MVPRTRDTLHRVLLVSPSSLQWLPLIGSLGERVFLHRGNRMDYSQKISSFPPGERGTGTSFRAIKRGRLGVGLLSVTAMTIAYFRVGDAPLLVWGEASLHIIVSAHPYFHLCS